MVERIEILRATTIAGRDVFVGDELLVPEECSLKDAEILIAMGKARSISYESVTVLVDALAKIDPENESLWSSDGRPLVTALAEVAGVTVSAAQRDAAWAVYLQGCDD